MKAFYVTMLFTGIAIAAPIAQFDSDTYASHINNGALGNDNPSCAYSSGRAAQSNCRPGGGAPPIIEQVRHV